MSTKLPFQPKLFCELVILDVFTQCNVEQHVSSGTV